MLWQQNFLIEFFFFIEPRGKIYRLVTITFVLVLVPYKGLSPFYTYFHLLWVERAKSLLCFARYFAEWVKGIVEIVINSGTLHSDRDMPFFFFFPCVQLTAFMLAYVFSFHGDMLWNERVCSLHFSLSLKSSLMFVYKKNKKDNNLQIPHLSAWPGRLTQQ